MKKIALIPLVFIACTTVSSEVSHYSDRNIEFDYPVVALLESYSGGSLQVSLTLREEITGKEKKIWLANRDDHSRNGAGFIRIFEGKSKEEAEKFLKQEILPSFCDYKILSEENGIEELAPYQEIIDPDGPFCNHSSYRLFRKGNVIIYKYTGVECIFSHTLGEANYECEEFINFRMK